MKKWIAGLLALALLLTGCGVPSGQESVQTESLPQKTTLMLYMIGSDLEAKAGAATRDLEEIAGSGIDLELVNVVVYAGGSPHWHNDAANPEEHTLLWLTEDGLTEISAVPTSSMGDADCLSAFLSYAYDAFPADQYALILWDHGDGPVIGYGKDMLFDNDTLTLVEMRQALENSPFATEKLAWVGFDACLMASAELSCLWADFADYLVASQEVEPSLGWDYSFLSQMGKVNTPTLLQALTDIYLQSCLEYYESRGYEHRDTTLSCVDLSYGLQLQDAVNALFAAAGTDIDSSYNAVTARRVQTRALGRATTGSEYDLIDLKDLATQLADLYPPQAQQLLQVLEAMVVANAANTDNCGGLSLYYPFYNKYYFEESWGQRYGELGLFADYLQYLQSYQQLWLREDLLEDATSESPQETDTGTYTLQLTEQQQETFASAKYYILVRDGLEYFTRIFVSPDVTNENGLLTAGFDGNVLYVTNDFGDYQIPVTIAHDTVGNQSRYSVFVTLTNYSLSLSYLPEEFEPQMQAHRFGLTLDRETGKVSVSSLVPYDHQSDTEILTGGKLEDTDLSQWASCFFLHDDHRYLTRYENGAVMPVDQWEISTLFSGYEYPIEDGLYFTYAPLAAGEYYLLFEVEDTQGNRYCSELLPMQTTGTLEVPESYDPVELSWTQGDRVLLTEQNGVAVELVRSTDSNGQDTFLLEATNYNDFPVRIQANDLFWGEDLYCDSYVSSLSLDPGQTQQAKTGGDFDAAHELGMLTPPLQMQLSLTVQNQLTGAVLMYQRPFRISLSDATCISPDAISQTYNDFHTPTLGAAADHQVLLDNDQMQVALLGLGGNGQDSTLRGAVYIENRTDQPLQLTPEGIVLNGIYVSLSSDESQIPAHSRAYRYFNMPEYSRKPSGITSVETATLLLKQSDYSPLFTGNTPEHLYWCPLELSTAAEASPFPEGSSVLFEEGGIQVGLVETSANRSSRTWQLAVTNNTEEAISLDLTDVSVNGSPRTAQDAGLYLSYSRLGAGQRCMAQLQYYYKDSPLESVSFRFRVLDFNEESILFTGNDAVTLYEP